MSTNRHRHERVEPGYWISPDTENTYARTIRAVELPPEVRAYVDEYERAVGVRDGFLWKWIHNLFDEFTLSCVDASHFEPVKRQKTLLTMWITTLDDLAEHPGAGAVFERARRIPFDEDLDDVCVADESVENAASTVKFATDVWGAFETQLRAAPRYDEFAEVFTYDLRQSINAMDYSRVLNGNRTMANLTEAERYDAHNMTMFPYACVDLMHSPSFARSEFGTLRSILADLQQMARIGNWITTWERELVEGDCSSGILVRALQRGVVSSDEIDDADVETADRIVERIRSYGIESEFIREWELRNRAVRKRTNEIESVDGDAIVDGLETVMSHHLASDGFK